MKATHLVALFVLLVSTHAKAESIARITGSLVMEKNNAATGLLSAPSAQVNLNQTTSADGRPFVTSGTVDKSLRLFQTLQVVNGTRMSIVTTRPPLDVEGTASGPIFKRVKSDVAHFKVQVERPDKSVKVLDKSKWTEEFAVGFVFQGTIVRGAVNCESEARWFIGKEGSGFYLVEKSQCNFDLEASSAQELTGESVRDLHRFVLSRTFDEMR